jgi:saccharopine dehydrogenase-like NADP-dependent oxidoreductase
MRIRKTYTQLDLDSALRKARELDSRRATALPAIQDGSSPTVPSPAPSSLREVILALPEEKLRLPTTCWIVLRWGDYAARMAFVKRMGLTDSSEQKRKLRSLLEEAPESDAFTGCLVVPWLNRLRARSTRRP